MKSKRKKPTEAEKLPPIEIRNHPNGRLDEIVAHSANVHLEQMDSNYWWMGLQIAGRHFHVRFNSAKGIRVTVDEDTPEGVTRRAIRAFKDEAMFVINTSSERRKPLGARVYGHIAHLPGSRTGAGDHKCDAGQARIACLKARDRHDHIIVQEKLDGSNVGVARIDGVLYPLTRAGYLADTSPFEQHWRFSQWVYASQDRFLSVLRDGERLVGEWLMQAHGTRYTLAHEPFVAFDLMTGITRTPYDEMIDRIASGDFTLPHVVHRGSPFSIEAAMKMLGECGFHGACERVEGAVWRVERDLLVNPGKDGERTRVVDFLVKYVRPDKQDGCYLPELSGAEAVWNWR